MLTPPGGKAYLRVIGKHPLPSSRGEMQNKDKNMTYGLNLKAAIAALFTTELALMLTVFAVTGSVLPAAIA